MGAENVQVAVRVRPFNSREKDRNAKLIIAMEGASTIITDPKSGETKSFTFDFSYWSYDGFDEDENGLLTQQPGSAYADQRRVFDDLGKAVLSNAYEGYDIRRCIFISRYTHSFNCSLFAYGQTGSGKSYSVVGYGPNKGIVPITCSEIFLHIANNTNPKMEHRVMLSMLEIYNEQVRDLLSKDHPKGGLKIRQHPQMGVYVDKLSEHPVSSYEQIDDKIEQGTKSRTIASTNMNATSSRAHTVICISFAQIEKDKRGPGKHSEKKCKINLVDLAGSERADSTGATGARLKEGAQINLSLTMLGNVINALVERMNHPKKKIVIPYRGSKLTLILQDALGGNSKTVMVAAISPADVNYDETLGTLRYADRAKQIKNHATVQIDPTELKIRKLEEENRKLMEMLQKGGLTPEMLAAAAAGQGGGEGGGGGGVNEEEVAKMKADLEAEIRGKSKEEVERMKKAMAEQVKNKLMENQRIMREMDEKESEWEQKLAEAKEQYEAKEREKEREKRALETIPHLCNLNEDPQLANVIKHYFKKAKTTFGRRDTVPKPDVELAGLSIMPDHGEVLKEDSSLTIAANGEARVLVNGHQIHESTEIHHNDTVMFGSSHLFAVVYPDELAKMDETPPKVTWESAQQQLAKAQGFKTKTSYDWASMSEEEKSEVLIQDKLLEVLPLVVEANAMAEEMDRGLLFEATLVNQLGHGVGDGALVTRSTNVCVKRKILANGATYLWDADKFISRVFLMRDMFQTYIEEGTTALDVEPGDDPFWDIVDETMIGTGLVYLNSLAYGLDIDTTVPVTDYTGEKRGQISARLSPCEVDGDDLDDEDFIEEPEELLGRPFNIKIELIDAKGLPKEYTHGSWIRYKFYSFDWQTTSVVEGTMNPRFDHTQIQRIEIVTDDVLKYFNESALVVEVWGKQQGSNDIVSTRKLKRHTSTKDVRAMETRGKDVQELEQRMSNLTAEHQLSVDRLNTDMSRIASENDTLRKQNDRRGRIISEVKLLVDSGGGVKMTPGVGELLGRLQLAMQPTGQRRLRKAVQSIAAISYLKANRGSILYDPDEGKEDEKKKKKEEEEKKKAEKKKENEKKKKKASEEEKKSKKGNKKYGPSKKAQAIADLVGDDDDVPLSLVDSLPGEVDGDSAGLVMEEEKKKKPDDGESIKLKAERDTALSRQSALETEIAVLKKSMTDKEKIQVRVEQAEKSRDEAQSRVSELEAAMKKVEKERDQARIEAEKAKKEAAEGGKKKGGCVVM